MTTSLLMRISVSVVSTIAAVAALTSAAQPASANDIIPPPTVPTCVVVTLDLETAGYEPTVAACRP